MLPDLRYALAALRTVVRERRELALGTALPDSRSVASVTDR